MTIKGLTAEENRAFVIVARKLARAEIASNPPVITEKEKELAKQKQLDAQQKYFEEYDLEAGEHKSNDIRKKLIVLTGWTPEMGDCELHFRSKPKGHQCFWAANWATGHGMLSPGSYYRLESMTSTELLCEARDAIHPGPRLAEIRSPDPRVIEKWIVPVMKKYEAGGLNFLEDLKKGLTKIRGAYSEFILPFDVPDVVGIMLLRPGWGTRAEIEARR